MIERGADRDAWFDLLELADEAVPLRGYLQLGDLFGVVDDIGHPRAAVLVIDDGEGTAELRAVAVAEDAQGRGLGTSIVREVIARLRPSGFQRVIVGTSSAGVRQLAFYQRLGFRLSHVERDFFNAARGYPADLCENGLRVRDMVWMDQPLK